MHANAISLSLIAASLTAAAFHLPVWAQNATTKNQTEPQLQAPSTNLFGETDPCVRGDGYPEPGGVPDVPSAIDCGEVIVPPPGVDAEITIPPPQPNAGTMPVLPPSAVDPQQP